MLIDLSDLVSVTDLSRDLSGYIGKASQEGRRVVILNRNVPTAALVSIEDLERLAALGAGDEASPPIDVGGEALPPVSPGYTRLGTKPGGVVDIPLLSTLMVSGATGSGTSVALSAAIANANPDPAAPPMQLVVVTERSAVRMYHELRSEMPGVVVVNDRADSKFKNNFLDGIAERLQLLRTSQCNTIAEYRAEHPGATITDFLVVLVDPRVSTLERFVEKLRQLVDPATFHEIGLYFWVFTQEAPILALHPMNSFRREGRLCKVAVGEQSAAASRQMFGSTIAADKPLESGHGYVQFSDDADGPTPMATQPPSEIDPWRLESTDTGCLGAGKGEGTAATGTFAGLMANTRTPEAAQAIRDYLAGGTIDVAYQQNGMTLPPIGTPVTNPVDPTQLTCGDIALFKDHYEPVLSSSRGYLNGEVVPLSKVVSSPDFVAFIDPTASN
ncbi:type II toxin-antitoxin system Phd/YefM family antitoxin [[Mycobacterium] nativiensis]|uniref:Type II toxin-antitoxin system Phd/YefM family antitoxin n=1 Tax=[Mycobacterium] nativiensis TaxID=2855503 RepID=A0ABU5Y2B4_9MYCO|nr:type II toxin-antitoxin system Phd/YefM family antitoxin [Mycolicibacter sp. MYC340]MEB3033356.1 type II toxin-antitoxin system Phd/YefM family antitoxin [Mycolicibacter sp. MYC340]